MQTQSLIQHQQTIQPSLSHRISYLSTDQELKDQTIKKQREEMTNSSGLLLLQNTIINFQPDFESISGFLKSIREELIQDPIYDELMDSAQIVGIIDYQNSYFLSHTQVSNLIKLVLDYMVLSRNTFAIPSDRLSTQFEKSTFAQRLGDNWSRLEHEIYFSNKDALMVLDYLIPKEKNELKNFSHCFFDLQFTLSDQEVLKVAKTVKNQCKYDMKSFCFLSNYLYCCCVKKEKAGQTISQIQGRLQEVLKILRKEHPASVSFQGDETGLDKHKSIKVICEDMPKLQVPKEVDKISKERLLERFICERSAAASDNFARFSQLVEGSCRKHGYNFKSSLKIKNIEHRNAISRVKQKMFKQKLIKFNMQNYLKEHSTSTIREMVHSQNIHYEKELERLLTDLEGPIKWEVDDLLRAKCMFSSLTRINDCCTEIIQKVEENGFKVIQLKNRLRLGTCDLVVIILIEQTLCELQLGMDFSVVDNEFNHKIYEILRSPIFSYLITLKRLNESLTNEFVQEYYSMIRSQTKEKVNLESTFGRIQTVNNDLTVEHQSALDTLNDENTISSPIVRKKSARQDSKLLQDDCNFNKVYDNFCKYLDFLLRFDVQFDKDINYFHPSYPNIKLLQTEVDKFISLRGIASEEIVIVDAKERQTNNLNFLLKANLSKFIKCLENFQTLSANDIALLIIATNIDGQKLRIKENFEEIMTYISYYKKAEMHDKVIQVYEKSKRQLEEHLAVSQLAEIMVDVAIAYEQQDNNNKAEQILKRSLKITADKDKKEEIKFHLGRIYAKSQKGTLALSIIQFDSQTSRFSKNRKLRQARCKYIEGMIYLQRKEYSKAIEAEKQCLDAFLQLYGRDSVQYYDMVGILGAIYLQSMAFSEAETLFTRNLQIKEKIYGKDSLYCVRSLSNLAVVNLYLGRYEKALKQFEKCYVIEAKQRGKTCIGCAISLINMSQVELRMLEYDKSEKHALLALQIYNLATQDQRSSFAYKFLENAGEVYISLRQFRKAFYYLYSALEIEVRSKGQDSITILNLIILLGKMLYSSKDYSLALATFKRGLELIKLNVKPEDIKGTAKEIVTIYNYIGLINSALLNHSSAIEASEAAIRISRRTKQNTLEAQNTKGYIYMAADKLAQAKQSFQKVQQSCHEKNDRYELFAQAHIGLGRLAAREGDYVKALSMLRTAASAYEEAEVERNDIMAEIQTIEADMATLTPQHQF